MGRRLQVGAHEDPSPDLTPSGAFGIISSALEDILLDEIGREALISRLRSHPMTAHVAEFLETRGEPSSM